MNKTLITLAAVLGATASRIATEVRVARDLLTDDESESGEDCPMCNSTDTSNDTSNDVSQFEQLYQLGVTAHAAVVRRLNDLDERVRGAARTVSDQVRRGESVLGSHQGRLASLEAKARQFEREFNGLASRVEHVAAVAQNASQARPVVRDDVPVSATESDAE